MSFSVLVSNSVFLPGREEPVPATVEIDRRLGVITAVHESRKDRDQYSDLSDDNWHDYGDKWLLPGLVEYV